MLDSETIEMIIDNYVKMVEKLNAYDADKNLMPLKPLEDDILNAIKCQNEMILAINSCIIELRSDIKKLKDEIKTIKTTLDYDIYD